jgi:hypothetical protein
MLEMKWAGTRQDWYHDLVYHPGVIEEREPYQVFVQVRIETTYP